MLSKYFTSNIENTEEKLIPKEKTVHVYGAMKDDSHMVNQVYCTKCGKEEVTSHFLSGLKDIGVPRCRGEIKKGET